jgi:formimidoylglutamate deiminase
LSIRLNTSKNIRLGIALHSLRAVPPEAITEALTFLHQMDSSAPVHIHIAEQMLEVEASIRSYGKRPVEWLLEQYDVDERWCLVHATHLSNEEITGIADSGATVCLCTTTEANLGDGLFPIVPYLQQGGQFAIGSDSNTSISPIEELRWLEYGQRLIHQRRNVIADETTPHTAKYLIDQALQGGARALGRATGKLDIGQLADIIVLDENTPQLFGKEENYRLDALVFNGNNNLVRDVLVAGEWVIKDYRHINESAITDAFLATIKRLQSS